LRKNKKIPKILALLRKNDFCAQENQNIRPVVDRLKKSKLSTMAERRSS